MIDNRRNNPRIRNFLFVFTVKKASKHLCLLLSPVTFLFKNRKLEVYFYTSGGTRCREDAIYVFHLQQCSSRHPPDLSIGIYPPCIKNPHTLLSRPALASVILRVVTQLALVVFHTSFPPYWGTSYISFRVMQQFFFQNFSDLFISSFLLVLSRYPYDIQLCFF
jgi:hypothetical protein